MKDWITPYLNQFKGRILLSLLFGIIGIGSGAMLLFVSGYLITKSSLQPVNIMVVYVPIVAVRAFSIGQAVFVYLEKLVSHDLVLRILEKMRTKLYHILEPQALFIRSRYQTGDLLGVLSDDIEHLQDFYIRTIFPSLLGLFLYGIVVLVLGLFNWVFAIMMALMLGVIVFLVPLISLVIAKKNHKSLKRHRSKLYQLLTDAIFGLTDWQASGRTEEFLEQAAYEDRHIIETQHKIQRWHYIRDAIIQLSIGLAVIAMLVWASIEAGNGTISPTVIAAFTLMIFSITDALAPLSDAIEHVPTYVDSLHNIHNVEDPEISSIYLNDVKNIKPEDAVIEINRLSYHYPESSKLVLNELSMTIPVGKKIAILGRSGTGKSTLLKLLAGGMEPISGEIKINGETVTSDLLSRTISVLNQKPHLFSTSIANNIRIGRPDATDEDVLLAAEKAQLGPLIDSLNDGINTQMREMGNRFSGGEKQRIAFARVLLQKTPIILVDEATIGLDPKTEQDLLKTMLDATKDKTVIWVTHHLVGVEQMNEVIFLDQGKISMIGTHNELLATNKHYQTLYKMDQIL